MSNVRYLQDKFLLFPDGWAGGMKDVFPGEKGYEISLPLEEANLVYEQRLNELRRKYKKKYSSSKCTVCGMILTDKLSMMAGHGPTCARKALVS